MEFSTRSFPVRDNECQSSVGRKRSSKSGRRNLRILVVRDFDLKSTAKLAESSLLSSNNIRNQRIRSGGLLLEKSVDLCIAVNTSSKSSTPEGLYDPDDEILPYYLGPTRRIRMLKTTTTTTTTTSGITKEKSKMIRQRYPFTYSYNGTEVGHLRGRPRIGKKMLSSSFRSIPVPVPLPPASQPVFYDDDDDDDETNDSCTDYGGNMGEGDDIDDTTSNMPCGSGPLTAGVSPEERAARRGLITAALSQLESIVCRVVYVLKDDRDDKQKDHVHLRLTSNSLDIRNRWLPLVEGLGVAGLSEEQEQTSVGADIHTDDSECDSNDESPSILSSDREQHRETSSGTSDNIAIVSPARIQGKIGKYSKLEGLLRSAHLLEATSEEGGDCGTNDEDPFHRDRDDEVLFQSIVITAAPVAPKTSPNKSKEWKKGELLSNSSLNPQKTECTNSENDFVRDHLLLEIAADTEAPPSSHSLSPKGDASTTVIVPGSLRTRGEFCLVDLVRDDEKKAEGSIEDSNVGVDSTRKQRAFRWKVEQTHFHRLESEQDTRDWA